MARIDIDTTPGSPSAKITLTTDDGLTGTMEMAPPQMLEFIQALGSAYATLTADAPTPDLAGQKVLAVGNANWLVHSEIAEQTVGVSFYHLRFGPVGFLLQMEQAQRLRDALSVAIDGSKSLRPKLH